ncbi:unnamed protein product [Prunus armeniaca]
MGVGGGAMVLGGMKSPHDMFGFCNCPYYNIELKGIYVAAYPLKLNPKVFDGGYGTVLDSGTFPMMLFLRLRILLVQICPWACPNWWIPYIVRAGFCALEVEIWPGGALCQGQAPALHLLLGGIVTCNILVTYDWENNKIGF